MLDARFFVDEAPQERTIKLPDGSEHAMRFRMLGHGEIRRISRQADDDEQGVYPEHRFVAACLVNGDGGPALSAPEAARLKAEVFRQMLRAANEVNGVGSESEQGKD